MRKTKKSLKNKVSKISGAFRPREATFAETINANADVLINLINEVEFLRKRVDELERAELSFNRSAEIEEILDAEMERRMME